MYFFYLFACADGTLYAGSTNNLERREQLHNAGKGAKYTRTHGGGKVVYYEQFATKSEALKREAVVKKLPRAKKQALAHSLCAQ